MKRNARDDQLQEGEEMAERYGRAQVFQPLNRKREI